MVFSVISGDSPVSYERGKDLEVILGILGGSLSDLSNV